MDQNFGRKTLERSSFPTVRFWLWSEFCGPQSSSLEVGILCVIMVFRICGRITGFVSSPLLRFSRRQCNWLTGNSYHNLPPTHRCSSPLLPSRKVDFSQRCSLSSGSRIRLHRKLLLPRHYRTPCGASPRLPDPILLHA